MNTRLMCAAILVALGFVGGCGGDYDHLVPLPPANVAPVASAGPAQSVFVDTQVALDGSGSTDANADPLTYAWTVTTKPATSNVTLSSATAVKPTFTPDVAGTYVFTVVVNDGKVDSPPATVTITAAVGEVAPAANAGAPQSVFTGAAVTLDGSASSDANGDTLTYAWTLTAPSGSSAVLTGATTAAPQFTPDVAGAYVASLVVNDGQLSSAASTVTVTAAVANVPPVANAGTAQNVMRGVVVTLNGGASSDANGDTLSYNWSLTSVPAGSAATLSAPNVVAPTLVPDLVGVYVVQLIVNDGQVNSTPVTVTITATPVTVTTDLIVNGSFEQGFSSWSQAAFAEGGTTGTCSYNVATAPGTETLTGTAGFAATDGTHIALGSVSAQAANPGHYNCDLYQDVAVPSGTTSLVLNFDVAVTPSNNSCLNAALVVGLYATGSTPGTLSPSLGGGRSVVCTTIPGTALATMTLILASPASVAGTTVRLVFINIAQLTGAEVIGIDKVSLIATTTN